MKAIRIHAFGGPEVIKYEDVVIPIPKDGEVLVKVAAAGVNPVDFKIRTGEFPQITQRDLPITLGREVCGSIENEVGSPEIIALLNWDAGGYADYVALPRSLCVPKPTVLSLDEAAGVPLAALTAWQGLFDQGRLKRGQRVLIHAGAGGVGHFAVQFAAQCGALVFSTASADNLGFLAELGATHVFDYKRQRFEEEAAEIDLVLDLVGGETRDRSWRVLRRGGTLVSTLGQPDQRIAAKHEVQAKGYMTVPKAQQLKEIVELIETRKVRVVLSKAFPLRDAAAAQEYLEMDHPRGKVVLSVGSSGAGK
jgi:NADPH:quinone reductase-like Zn-dependent oxidoreductase